MNQMAQQEMDFASLAVGTNSTTAVAAKIIWTSAASASSVVPTLLFTSALPVNYSSLNPPSDTTVLTRNDGLQIVLRGSGLSAARVSSNPINGPYEISGTVTSIEVKSQNGALLLSISDFALPLDNFLENLPRGPLLNFAVSSRINAINAILNENNNYAVTDAGDRVVEAANGGYDQVLAQVSYTLQAGQEIEGLYAENTASTTPINLTGNEFGNTLLGSNGVNALDGRSGNDVIAGYDGNDSLFGGDGDDLLTSGSDRDLIQGGAGHDTATFALNRSNYVVTQTGSLTTVRALSGQEGTDTIASTETLRFADQDLQTRRIMGDLNGDGRDDFVFQNQGQLGLWLMNGLNPLSTSDIQSPGSGWTVVGLDDTNGDQRDDLILQNGQTLAVWTMNGNSIGANGVVGTLGDGWQVAGTGDVNGDGKADLLLQNGQQLGVWELNGPSLGVNGEIGTLADGWQVAGMADLNGDGKADILLQNGQSLAPWYMDGLQVSGADILGTMGSGWSVVGTGDLDGDRQADILLQNGSLLAPWLLKGDQIQGGPVIGSIQSGWSYAGIADMTGDGRSDIVLQNGSLLAEWQLNGSSIQGGGIVNNARVGPGWELV